MVASPHAANARAQTLGELQALAKGIQEKHLSELLEDADRNELLFRSSFIGPLESSSRPSTAAGAATASSSGDEAINSTSSCSSLGPANLGIVADFTRQKVTQPILQKLLQYASEHCQLQTKILQMHSGEIMNATEGRKVLHTALRIPAPPASTTSTSSSSGSSTGAAGKMKMKSSFYDPEVASEVLRVRAEIKEFAEQVRGGHWLGCTGRKLQNVLSIGIGGSYLGVEFVLEALRTEESAAKAAVGRKTQFLANVDPIDIKRAVEGFDPESTLVVICSKTFTTAETILNAESVKKWLLDALRPRAAAHHGVVLAAGGKEKDDPEGTKGKDLALLEKAIISKHVVAVSTNKPLTEAFGIQKTFDFWDWVGGRFSVCSAVGLLPLSLQFGSEIVTDFLAGAHAMDEHFYSAPLHESLPVLLGLVQFWNRSFLDYSNCAVLPYCQALHRFTAHIQQLDMESNGKSVSVSNLTSASGASKSGSNYVNQSPPVDMHTGAIYFGEPGTNAQHSFYQLLHQGTTVVPCEFIGFTRSQNDVLLKEEGRELSNHDELMANFFAQPDALALGRSLADSENNPHKTFPGDRPSTLLLFNGKCDAWTVGLLLALYEHRTAVQGWLWGINSFDQYGVELGKVLAKKVTGRMKQFRGLAEKKCDATVAAGTDRLLGAYLQMTAN